MLMQVCGDAGAGHLALVDADVPAVRVRDLLHYRHRQRGGLLELEELGVVQIGDETDVAVRADHQMPHVVRVQVHDGEHMRAAPGDQTVLVGLVRSRAERALLGLGFGDLAFVIAQHVGHALRRPQPLDRILLRRELRGVVHARRLINHDCLLRWSPTHIVGDA